MTASLFYENFSYGDYYGADLKQYALGLQNIYVLTTGTSIGSSGPKSTSLLFQSATA